jgi:predicted AAA+ superfamily ATPase
MASDGSDPVVELQTNFGGGKTHSMLALWHLFSGRPVAELPGIDAVIAEAKAGLPEQVRRVVLVGNKISPGQPVKKDDGTVVRTLWGELAWQLGGKEGFALVKQSDETATNPGDALGKLLRKYSPCLILIDEWVAYARGLHDTKDLPAGDFETQFTFAQTLTEEVKGVPGAMLVVSLPASADGGGGVSPTSDANDEEVGGVRGRMALAALRNVVSRVATAWRPANAEESFEIVRRRLFQPLPEPNYASRDNTAKAFCDLYRSNHQEFPPECRETDYERKLKAAYPIHPEIFDRLYQDWSALVKFQRTRGVLRLMAAVIHQLWESNDRSPLILPASIPLDDPGIVSQLTSYLPGGWETVIEKDVDGADALPRKLDSEKPNLGRFSACRRVARTLFLGSAPIPGAANRGEEDRRIKLGCVLPGEAPAVFGDALRHLAQAATYLYQDNARYWYATQPTVTKLADDRAEQLRREPDRVWEEIRRRVREDLRSRGEFPKIQPFPNSSGDVPDEMEVRLVVLDVEKPYAKEGTNHALEAAKEVLVQRGNSPRIYQNTLVFLAADRSRLDELEQAARYYLAWHSITEQETELNLDKSQSKQAATQKGTWDRTTTSRIGETYQWLLVPTQPGPQSALEWQQTRLTGADALAARASKKLRNDGQMVAQFAATFLRQALDVIPLWRGNHVAVKQLIEDFARYPYLQRLRDGDVLLNAMREGVSSVTWRTDTFAFAEAFDEAKGRYLGLRGGQVLAFGSDAIGLLVKGATADAQIESDRPKLPAKPVGAGADTPGAAQPVGGSTPAIPAPGGGSTQVSPTPTHFFGSVKVDVARISRDVGTIANEIIQHLASLPNSEIIVTLEIQARVPGGVPDNVVRTVSENCRTLKFKSQSFERE